MTFREKLVILRKIKGITQEEFACAVGVSRQAVYKWESGQSYPEVPKLLEMKLLFTISIDDLLDDSFDIELPKKKRKKRTPKVQPEATAEAAPVAEAAPAPVEEAPKAKKAPKAKAAPVPVAEAAPAPVVEAPKAEAKEEPKTEKAPKKTTKAAPKSSTKTNDIKDDLKYKSELLRKLFAKK